MKIKSLSIMLILLLLLSSAVYADLWDKQINLSRTKVKSESSWSEQGGFYRGGVDFDRAYEQKDISVTWEHKMGLGCAGFGISENFFSGLSGEALQNYLTGLVKNALAASPELLLAYLSPTLYDKFKDLKSVTGKLLDLRMKSCEDMQKEVLGSNWFKKAQASSRAWKINQAVDKGTDKLSETVKETGEIKVVPLDYDGKLTSKVEFVGDGVAWLKKHNLASGLAIDKLAKVTGDVSVTEDSVEYKPPEKTIEEYLDEYRKEYKEGLKKVLEKYDAGGPVAITDEDLKKLCSPNIPINRNIIESLGIKKGDDREIWLGKIAGELAKDRIDYEIDGWKKDLRQARSQAKATGDEGKVAFLEQEQERLTQEQNDLRAAHEQANQAAERVFSTLITITEEDLTKARNEAAAAAQVSRRKEIRERDITPLEIGGLGFKKEERR